MKVIVIGGVAAGMSAASKLKRNLRDDVEIVVYEKGGVVSYGACGLPFFVSDRIKQADELIARRPEEFAKSGIDVRIYHQVTTVNFDKKQLTIVNQKTGEIIKDTYDKLIIGSGASVKKIPPFDIELENLYQIRDIEDASKFKEALKQSKNRRVVVVGAGFIGLEIVDACCKYQKEVILIEAADRILNSMDREITDLLAQELDKQHICVKTNTRVSRLVKQGQMISAVEIGTAQGIETIQADLVVNCVGIVPNTDFLTGIEKAENGALIVNERMETSVLDVYAAGDCSIMKSSVSGVLSYAPLGTNANKQGRIIGDILGGKQPKPFKLINSVALRLFSLDAAKTGLSEQEAKQLGIPYRTNLITGNSYASYYGTEQVTIKVIYHAQSRKILGAQAVGQGIVVPRVNYYAVAVYTGLTVEEFGFLDLCYSPPFSGVWDAALIASNTAK